MMKRLFTKLFMIAVCWLSVSSAMAQQVVVNGVPNVVCLGNPLQVYAFLAGANVNDVTSYRFDWGNGDSSINNTGKPVVNNKIYQYPTAGIYTITVTGRFSNRAPLTTSYVDTIYNRPQASYTMVSLDSQCFKYNSYCFKDNTQPGAFPSLPLKNLIFTYGDGDSNLVASLGTACHHYYSSGNKRYNITLTTTDIGGCETKAYSNVFVAPNLNPRFLTTGIARCDTSPYRFVNNTPISTSDILWFHWNFDDGTTYTSANPLVGIDTMWSLFTHKYTINGVFNPMLVVRHKKFNCADTFIYSTSGQVLPENIVLRFDIKSKRTPNNDTIADSICAGNLMQSSLCLYNEYPISGINTPLDFFWHFHDPPNAPNDVKFDVAPCYKYSGQGHKFPTLTITCPGQAPKTYNFWSRIDTVQLSDSQYVPPPIKNPAIYSQNGYFFQAKDSISLYRWIMGNNGLPRDSLAAYWDFFKNDPSLANMYFKRSQLQGYGVNVMGPTVAIEAPPVPIKIDPLEKSQCGPDYPVHFTNASSGYQSNNLYIKWDFSDDFAPKCTSFSIPDPSKPNAGLEPYTTAADMTARTLGRFIYAGQVYPGSVMCNFSHDTLPTHTYQKWSDIFRWYYYGHDFPPFDSSATGWTNDPAKFTGTNKLVHKLDSAKWGLPTFSAGVTPQRTDWMDRMWPADINPNRPIVTSGMIPDPFASAKGFWQYSIPSGVSLDTAGPLKPALQDTLPDGTARVTYRGNMKLPGSNKTLYEYFFDRTVQACYTVRLNMKDSFNNQSGDQFKTYRRIDMVNNQIIIEQRTDTTPGFPITLVSDTFRRSSTPKSIDYLVDDFKVTNAGTGYTAGTYDASGGSGFGLKFQIAVNGGAVSKINIINPGLGYKVGETVTLVGGNSNATVIINTVYEGLIYNYKPYRLMQDGGGYYIMKFDDEFFVDAFDCGGESTVQLPLVKPDAYGVGQSGKICPGLKEGDGISGGWPQIVFDNSAASGDDPGPQNAGTYPACSQRSMILINYDSLLDRRDQFPCQLDNFVDWGGISPVTGTNITPSGERFPGFFNDFNFPTRPGGPWTDPNGAVNWTHYEPTEDPWPYSKSPVDPRGYVTIGIQIFNGGGGNPTSPLTCASQTVWYHNFFHFIRLNANFTYRKVGGYNMYGVPSKLPSQDYLFDTTTNWVQNGPVGNPVLYTPNGGRREPWSRLFGRGDILEFDNNTLQQEFVWLDKWSWGDNVMTVDSFITNQGDTFVELDPINKPGVKTFFEKNSFPVRRVRVDFDMNTAPYTVLSTSIPYETGKHVYFNTIYDTIWQCNDLTHQLPPQSVTPRTIYIDTAFFMYPVRHQFFITSYDMTNGPGTTLKKNDITTIQHQMLTTTKCSRFSDREIVIGVMDTFTSFEGNDLSDGILCIGQTVHFVDSIRYWLPFSSGPYNPSRPLPVPGPDPLIHQLDMFGSGMNNYPIDSIKTYPNITKYYSTLNNFCPVGEFFFAQGAYNFCAKIDTNFYERIYWDFESDGVIDYAGKNPSHKFDKPGQYKVAMITRDTVGYFDTCVTVFEVIEPVAAFTNKNPFACSDPTIFHDSSYIIDSSFIKTGFPVDRIIERRWWFGDYGYGANDYRSTSTDPYYPYRKNGWYRVQQVVETFQGCFDTTFKDIYISGPRPRIKLLNDTLGCVPYTVRVVSYPNDSGNFSGTAATMIRSGRSDGGYDAIVTANPDTVTITYDAEGVYYITAVGYDKNPIVLSTCPPIIIPDTVGGLEQPIKVYVKNPYHVGIESSKDKVCVGEVFEIKNTSDKDTITKFRMYAYNDDYTSISDTAFKTNYGPDSSFKYLFYQSGQYNLVLHSTRFIANTPPCESRDTVHVTALKAKAGLQIDSLGLPKFRVWNRSDSASASNYIWTVYNPNGTVRTGIPVPSNTDPYFHLGELDFKNDTGTFKICLWAYTEGLENCYDSVCKEVTNTFSIDIYIPNVFTPNNDAVNDLFNIRIKGEELYDLKIWNRWGGLVFESTDSKTMWNGQTNNTGGENPEGTYYYVFRYRLRTQQEQTVRGTITLLRD